MRWDGKMTDEARTSLIGLLNGVHHFSSEVFPQNQAMFADLALGQAPHTLFITCADSRISPGMITQNAPGNLFVLRNIGNIVPAYGEMLGGVSAAIEYAVVAIGVENIIVCGHSDCGAMKAMLDPLGNRLQAMPTVSSWLRSAEAALAVTRALMPPDPAGSDPQDVLPILVEQNVLLQLAHLRTHPAVAARLAEGRLTVQGWVYDIRHGVIRVLDEQSRRSISVEQAVERLRLAATTEATP
jgi:carbonic anhydrase